MTSELTQAIITLPGILPVYNLSLPKKLTDEERARHERNEATIARTLRSFEECGDALVDERNGFLFRETHATFQDYCREKWGIGARRARQIIAGREVVKTLAEGNPHRAGEAILPSNEKQVRPLVGLPTEKQREVWSHAVKEAGGAQPTARQVKEAKEKVVPPEEEWTESDMARWIPMAVKIFSKMGLTETASINYLFEHQSCGPTSGGWSLKNSMDIFDRMVENDLLVGGRLVDSPKDPAKKEPGNTKASPPLKLKTAQKLYVVGMAAAGVNKPWAQAAHHTQLAMLGIAQWHLEQIEAMSNTAGKMVAVARSKKSPASSRPGRMSPKGRAKIKANARARWNMVKAKARTSKR